MLKRAVYAVAGVLILGSLLFPPWVLHTRAISMSQGYGFILDGPSVSHDTPVGVLDLQRLAVQIAAIAVAAMIALVVAKTPGKARAETGEVEPSTVAPPAINSDSKVGDPATAGPSILRADQGRSPGTERSGWPPPDQPVSKWLRGALAVLAGFLVVAIVTAARDIMGLHQSYGLAGPGFLGSVTLLGVWYLTSNAQMIRPVAIGILGAVLLGAAGVALQIVEGSMRPNAEAFLDEAPAPNASASGTSLDTSGLNPVDRDLLSDEDIFGPPTRATE